MADVGAVEVVQGVGALSWRLKRVGIDVLGRRGAISKGFERGGGDGVLWCVWDLVGEKGFVGFVDAVEERCDDVRGCDVEGRWSGCHAGKYM